MKRILWILLVFAVASLVIIGCDSTGNTGDSGDSTTSDDDDNGDNDDDNTSTQEDGTLTINLTNWNDGGDQDDIDGLGTTDQLVATVTETGSDDPVGIQLVDIAGDGSCSFTVKEFDTGSPSPPVGTSDFTGSGGTSYEVKIGVDVNGDFSDDEGYDGPDYIHTTFPITYTQDGNKSISTDYNSNDFDGNLFSASISNASGHNGENFVFWVMDGTDPSTDIVAYGSEEIESGSAWGLVWEDQNTIWIGDGVTNYNVILFIDVNDNDELDSGDYFYDDDDDGGLDEGSFYSLSGGNEQFDTDFDSKYYQYP
jgi:hypothetical protein